MVAERLGREVQRAVNVAAAAAAALVKTASITAFGVDTDNGNGNGNDGDGDNDGDALTEDTSDQLYAALLETVPCLVLSVKSMHVWCMATHY